MNVDVSPDGKTIVFDLLGDLYTVPLAGGRASRITSGPAFDSDPVFSPDGNEIAFTSDRDGSLNIWIVGKDGAVRQFTKETSVPVEGASWLAAGDFLLAAQRDNAPWLYRADGSGVALNPMLKPGVPPIRDEVTWSRDGGSLFAVADAMVRRVDLATGHSELVSQRRPPAFRPGISPDGKFLVFASRREAKTGLRIVDLTTQRQRWLVYPLPDLDNSTVQGIPSLPRFGFLPDGSALILATGGTFQKVDLASGRMEPIPFTAVVELEIASAAGGTLSLEPAADPSRAIRDAARDRDDRRTVFAAAGRIWVQEGNRTPRAVSMGSSMRGPIQMREPALSPDGEAIAFVTWHDLDQGQLWRVSVRGGDPKALTKVPAVYRHPVWSPDGAKIAVIREEEAGARGRRQPMKGVIYLVPAGGGTARSAGSVLATDVPTFSTAGDALLLVARPTGPGGSPAVVSRGLATASLDTIAILPPNAEQIAIAPNGRRVGYRAGEGIFLAEIPVLLGVPARPVTITESGGLAPARRVATDRAADLRWDGDDRLRWVKTGAMVRLSVPVTPKRGDSAPAPEVIPLEAPVSKKPAKVLALTGATVITMVGDQVVRDATVIVTGDRITAVGPRASTAIPAGARRIDLSGKTIIPGLIDLRATIQPALDQLENTNLGLAANLAFGVTTVRSAMSGDSALTTGADLAGTVESGPTAGSRMVLAVKLPADAPPLDSPDAIKQFIATARGSGAASLTVTGKLLRRRQQTLARAAREAGIAVSAEVGDLTAALTLALDGYREIQGTIPNDHLYQDVRQLLSLAGVTYVPTLLSATGGRYLEGGVGTAEDYFLEKVGVGNDPKLRVLGLDTVRSTAWRMPEEYRFLDESRQAAGLAARGAPLAVGTDGKRPGLGTHWEMWALQLGGLSAKEALRAATASPAAALGLSRELGAVAPGFRADLVVLDGDPLADLGQSRTTRYVVKNGRLFDATTLAALWPDTTPAITFRDDRLDPPPARDLPREVGETSPVRDLPAGGSATKAVRHDSLPIPVGRTLEFETTVGSLMSVDVSPDGRLIVFDLLGDIYTVPIGGGPARQLSRGLGYDARPVWSPDGKSIAFVSDAGGDLNLWIMDADGGHARSIADERYFKPSFSVFPSFTTVEWWPDGRSLIGDDTVYAIDGGKRKLSWLPAGGWPAPKPRPSRDGRYFYFESEGVRRYDPATEETIQLARPAIDYGEPLVSPNGRWLTYLTGGEYSGLRCRNLETGAERWLAYPLDKNRPYWTMERYAFTPDSRSVIIGYGGKIHRIDVESGADQVVPFNARATLELGDFDYHQSRITNDSLSVRYIRNAVTSPDGKTMVFTALQRLYLLDLPNGKPRRLLPSDEVGQFQPSYSPDGKWIAYVSWSDVDGGYLWKVPAKGGAPERLISMAGYYQRPVWSPDGSVIAFYRAGTVDYPPREAEKGWLQVIPSAGGTPRTVAEGLSRFYLPTFTPDGTRIIVQEDAGDDFFAGPSKAELVSLALDGSDRRVLARAADGWLNGPIAPSPDGRYLAYLLREVLYLARVPDTKEQVFLTDTTGPVPIVRLGYAPVDLHWEQGGKVLTWVTGNQVFRVDPERAMAGLPAGYDHQFPPRVAPDTFLTIRLTAPRRTGHGVVALRGARVITMRGDEVLEDGTIVITDDRITAIGPSATTVVPNGATVFDLRGKTIMPGLVDLHGHFAWRPDERLTQHDWNYQATLAYGVTTAREVSGNTSHFGDVEQLEAGALLGPRLLPVGGAMLVTRIDNLDDARQAVAARKVYGVVSLKQYMQPTRRKRQWVLLAAEEMGLNVTNEAGHDAQESMAFAIDGMTGVEHTINNQWFYGDITHAMAKSHVWYTPTLMNGYGGSGEAYYRRRDLSLILGPKYRRFVPWEDPIGNRRGGPYDDGSHQGYHDFPSSARRGAEIVRQGGRVTLGSHGNDIGLGAHWDLWALASGGFTKMEALRAATYHGIEGLGLQQDLGSLEVGKIADLLVLDANPLENIENTMTIRYVMKNGELFDGETLSTLWPTKRKLPDWMYEDQTGLPR